MATLIDYKLSDNTTVRKLILPLSNPSAMQIHSAIPCPLFCKDWIGMHTTAVMFSL